MTGGGEVAFYIWIAPRSFTEDILFFLKCEVPFGVYIRGPAFIPIKWKETETPSILWEDSLRMQKA